MLTDENINNIKFRVEGAFKPLRCVAEIWDYKQKLRFKVFDNDNHGIIEIPSIVLRDLTDESRLQDVIEQTREQVKSKGFVLIGS